MAKETVKELSEKTIASYRLSYAQFEKFMAEKKTKKATVELVAEFVKASAAGFPNNRPKKPSAIGIKYKGITWVLNEMGTLIEFERNFVNKVLNLAIPKKTAVKRTEPALIDDEPKTPPQVPVKTVAAKTNAVRVPRN